ncbi:hypothetical protein BKA69DRAFT_770955 [Paraphysoderma sedebokerense]|nr:hypothetical protein BKA69DRAFT_770955 [Paraphysoderma sedebokerense]
MESIRGSAWSYPVDRFLMTFSVLVALALGVALFMMTLWHIYLICTGQTQIEYYGNNYMKWYGKSTGEVFINEFDVGWKGNLRIFFNISKLRPWYTILIPISVPPVGNGTVYPTYHDYDVNSIYDTLPLENIHIM